jgi:hypothetical protein
MRKAVSQKFVTSVRAAINDANDFNATGDKPLQLLKTLQQLRNIRLVPINRNDHAALGNAIRD